MKRRTFISAACIGIGATLTGVAVPLRAQGTGSTSGIRKQIRMALSTPGRIGFYMDYSELDVPGTHSFYVNRTHGTAGTVSVRYATSGDAHNSVDGVLTWQDGEADIKYITVDVTSKVAGDHRVYVTLSGPTGGAVLHYGPTHTVAYGVIDDGSISNNAVFFNAGASRNGSGSQSDPYDNIYDAIANVGSARYIYGQGTTTIDGTNSSTPSSNFVECIAPPAGRSGESNRLFIQQWPGQADFIIQGDGASRNQGGFVTEVNNQGSWVTYKGISFRDLDQVSNGWGGGIGYHYSANGTGVNVELCTFDNINCNDNVAAIMPWGLDGMKVWRCSGNDVKVNGSQSNQNATGLLQTYDGNNISVQRSRASNCYIGVFHKRIGNVGVDVSTNVKFCHFIDTFVGYGASGTSGASHSFSVVQGNLFENAGSRNEGIFHLTRNTSNVGQKAGWWCNNIFDSCGSGEQGAVHIRLANGAMIFNNIMVDCRRIWTDIVDHSPQSDVEYANYNHEYRTTYSQKYEWRGRDYSSAAALNDATGFEQDVTGGDPLFSDRANNDYSLRADSPAIGTGVSGTDKGVYLTGLESIGPGIDLVARIAPSQMEPVSISNV